MFQDRVKQQLPTFASRDPVESRFIPSPPRAALHTSKEQCTAANEEALSRLMDDMVFWGGGIRLVPNTVQGFNAQPSALSEQQLEEAGSPWGPICP